MIELLDNNDFLMGVLSGIVASGLFLILIKILNYVKDFILNTRILNVWNKSNIRHVYDNLDECIAQMYKDAKESTKICVFSNLAETFTNKTSVMNTLLENRSCDIKFLLLSPFSSIAHKRAEKIAMSNFVESINGSVKVLKDFKHIKYSFHDENLRLRAYVFDDALYLLFGLEDKHAVKSQVWRIEKNSILYNSLNQQFNDLWEKYYKSIENQDTACLLTQSPVSCSVSATKQTNGTYNAIVTASGGSGSGRYAIGYGVTANSLAYLVPLDEITKEPLDHRKFTGIIPGATWHFGAFKQSDKVYKSSNYYVLSYTAPTD